MKTFGIIGNPLGHSFSKSYFTNKIKTENIDAEFLNFELAKIEDLKEVLNSNPNLKGFCVTIPYKEAIIPFLDELDPLAEKIGAANSIQVRLKNGKIWMKGYNTDIYGFTESLNPFLGNTSPKALVLGTGGASKAIAKGLETLNIEYRYVSRSAGKENHLTYDELNAEIIQEYKLIVNCSPLGTFPNTEECPNIPYEHLTPEHYLYDLVYNPDQTLFMRKGAEKGAKTHNGLRMLHLQAEQSWMYWNEE
ncbi:MAG: shikimate dehydrogenase [Marinifilaceae bacterium]